MRILVSSLLVVCACFNAFAGGVGTTKETRLWWITPRGAAALAEAAP